MIGNTPLIDSLESALAEFENVYVTFNTKTGKVRTMHCTKVPTVNQEGRDNPALNHSSIITVYDHQNSAWRSFRKDRVISFEVKL
jgi:hypothetical protein